MSTMSTRRLPLSTNPNAANSPLRTSVLAPAHGSKRTRSHAEQQREEAYRQPPLAKRQMLERGVQSPSRSKTAASRSTIPARSTAKPTTRAEHARSVSTNPKAATSTEGQDSSLRQWQSSTRARLPTMVFYFDSISADLRGRLVKQLAHYGAREEKFFSIDITHVVTSRPIPPEKPAPAREDTRARAVSTEEQPETIDPSLLDRTDPKKKLAFETTSSKPPAAKTAEDVIRRPSARSADLLNRARDMNKKIWSLEKLQKILDMLDPNASYGTQRGTRQGASGKQTEATNLLQMLHNERVNGPSDRDPTVATKEMHYFKGPFICVVDMEEKTKPIMAREYARVAEKTQGEWPQFRVVSQGRCPFVEEAESKEERAQRRPKDRVVKAGMDLANAPSLRPPAVTAAKPATRKRTLAEMEHGHNQTSRRDDVFDSKAGGFGKAEFPAPQSSFMSRLAASRFTPGEEPAASGIQKSKATSAIRSQMMSSTSGVLGIKAGTSKEFHGLKRKVLQKASTPAVSQDLSSRRMGEASHDSNTFVRSASYNGHSQRNKLDVIGEADEVKPREGLRRAGTMPITTTGAKQRARDPKPGFCENCQDKFSDFEEHVVSRKHRKFAETDENWSQLDSLLCKLQRNPRHTVDDSHEEDDDDDDDDEW